MAEVWSREEVNLVVDAYFSMLELELRGASYSKSKVRQTLLTRIDRSAGSIEYKLANVSAALIEVGGIPINGYKPRKNIQQLLRETVAEKFRDAVDLRRSMLTSVSLGHEKATFGLGNPSEVPDIESQGGTGGRQRQGRFVDYQEVEARNRSLGHAGEEAVVRHERHRLLTAGAADLASQVRHVSLEDGDGLGYDVRSFDLNGEERFIEVKTTRSVPELPFLVSRNEVKFSEEARAQFSLYRLFRFGSKRQGFYILTGALSAVARLDPVQFSGTPRAS